MSSNTANQQNQQLHYFPLPPPFKSKSSPIRCDSKLTSFCKKNTKYYTYDTPLFEYHL